MDTMKPLDTPQQVFAMVGNQCVVFGSREALPQALLFDPERDSPDLPRVAGVDEATEARVLETLQVAGFKKIRPTSRDDDVADVIFSDGFGKELRIDVKMRDHELRARDFEQAHAILAAPEAAAAGLQVWFFNRERLKLTMVKLQRGLPHREEFHPLDVWEKTVEGIFRRATVVREVEQWVDGLSSLYDQIQTWLGGSAELAFDRSRTVVMAEHLMQLYAVAERELPILDVLSGSDAIASFVPRGLWLIGARGRVDLITAAGTTLIVGVPDPNHGPFHWQFVQPDDRRSPRQLSRDLLLSVIQGA